MAGQIKLNIVYFGRADSHCSSCWEPADEFYEAVLTQLSREEVMDGLREYFRINCIIKYLGDATVIYENQLLREFIDHIGVLKITDTGHNYPPSFTGDWAGEEIDLSTIHEKDFFTLEEYQHILTQREKSRQEQDKMAKLAADKKKAKQAEQIRKAELKELERLKSKYE